MLSYPAATTRACWASRPQHWLFSQTSPLTSKPALTWPDCHHTDPLVCLPGCKIDTTASPMWVNAGRRWHRRPFSHLTVFQRSCCLILVKWYKWLVHFVNPPASRCGLKLSYLAYFHLATVEECDSTAAEVLVAFFFTWWAALYHAFRERNRHSRGSENFSGLQILHLALTSSVEIRVSSPKLHQKHIFLISSSYSWDIWNLCLQ